MALSLSRVARFSVPLNILVLLFIIYISCVSKEHPKPRLFSCEDKAPRTHYGNRRDYIVLYNYFKSSKIFRCDESITYTTHADWTFLHNLVPLLERWQGPISIALYCPGDDFLETFKRILAQRECGDSPLVKEFVTFHLYFPFSHLPNMTIPRNPEALSVNCSDIQKYLIFSADMITYRNSMNLTYPVNVGRNVAREMATTHYVFPSDIELYPSPNLIPQFLDMISNDPTLVEYSMPKVFVLPIFEVEANVTRLPFSKQELVEMLWNGSAVIFHKYVCQFCHKVPQYEEWLNASIVPGLRVFHVGKRYKPYNHWEPIYIGTNQDPSYDERLSWEGRRDKMTQGFVLCVLDYEFHILDNAFLIHRPGIKRPSSLNINQDLMKKQSSLIDTQIMPELNQLYGYRNGCAI